MNLRRTPRRSQGSIPSRGASLLRDRTRLTKILVLNSLRGGENLRSISRDLGITVQAVHSYVRTLEHEGHVRRDRSRGRWEVTPRGLQLLVEELREVRSAVDALVEEVERIEVTSARAANRIRKGEKVGLFMERGLLVAKAHTPSPSQGIALCSADPGSEVLVGSLEGIVSLEPATLYVVSVPGPQEGGVASLPRFRVRETIRSLLPPGGHLALHGTGAKLLADELGLSGAEFAPVASSFNACERGVGSVLLVTRDLLESTLRELDRLNERTISRVPIKTVVLEP